MRRPFAELIRRCAAVTADRLGRSSKAIGSFFNDRTFRNALYQAALLGAVVWLGYELVVNARSNLYAQTGFGFFKETAGFSVAQALIPYNESDSYGRVFVVGLLNTLLVSALGIFFATILGVFLGIARLSPNWLLARLAGAYVELVRNLPLLFQILFWYLAVIASLPSPRQAISISGQVFLSNRGLFVPRPDFQDGSMLIATALALGVALTVGVFLWIKKRRGPNGRFRAGAAMLALAICLIGFAIAIEGLPIRLESPQLRGFNFVGGIRILPELAALLVALSTYTAAFIAEIVRAGIQAVPRGQVEAAYSVGLRRGPALRLIVIPQALRVIIPPLTSQYLNLIKNSSLAYAVGYPDLVSVFAGTTLNQTGQAIEIIAITMGVYLLISLLMSALMNWYNMRSAIVER